MIYHPNNDPTARYIVQWDGYAESPYKVVDTKTKSIIKEFTAYETPRPMTDAVHFAIELNEKE